MTSRELITRMPGRAGSQSSALYVSRHHLEQATVQDGVLRLRSAGTDLTVTLRSRKLAAAAASWLTGLAGCDHIPADS